MDDLFLQRPHLKYSEHENISARTFPISSVKGAQHEGCIEICIDSPSLIPLSPLGAPSEGHSVFLWKSPSSKLWISGTTC